MFILCQIFPITSRELSISFDRVTLYISWFSKHIQASVLAVACCAITVIVYVSKIMKLKQAILKFRWIGK